MSGYQGHGSVATPHGILLTWALMMKGGLQVNRDGRRFWNEHLGYSEAAEQVLAQPGGIAWNVYDEAIHRFALDFPTTARRSRPARSAARPTSPASRR